MLTRALDLLREQGVNIVRRSSTWQTAPQDVEQQPWFLNLVVEAETAALPRQLLHQTQRIERQLGRRRLSPKGPRTIDIDILLFGAFVILTNELEIPHPRLAQRRFVLAPLAELVPDLRHPITHATVREMLAEVKDQPARRLDR